MSLKVTKIEKIPEDGYRRGPRDSVCLEAVNLALEEPGKPVQIAGDDPTEVTKVYKALIQWRARNQGKPVLKGYQLGIRKGREVVYLWVDKV